MNPLQLILEMAYTIQDLKTRLDWWKKHSVAVIYNQEPEFEVNGKIKPCIIIETRP